ncbi:serine/threonine-protein phosphatase 2A 55 kDa regulatory subunit B alpha isoform isoform X1 [Numida meleagris]|nr:serine/threonine-protein phosphatase 2A 55 kDa regulatory subunit B alpha isoform isoform X1 [Numida meleagris]
MAFVFLISAPPLPAKGLMKVVVSKALLTWELLRAAGWCSIFSVKPVHKVVFALKTTFCKGFGALSYVQIALRWKIEAEEVPGDPELSASLIPPNIREEGGNLGQVSGWLSKWTKRNMWLQIFPNLGAGGGNDIQWCFSQVKGAVDDDVAEADIISTVEFNHSGELLATGDKGGRVVIFQQEQENKTQSHSRGEYNVYSTFQSHEPEFDYLKSLEIEEKINKIRWLPQKNAAQFLLSTNDKTIKLWKISERDKRPEGYNLKEEDGRYRDPTTVTTLRVPVFRPMDLMVEASPRRIFANAHTYHINSISINSDYETYLSADDLRINLWHLEITDRSFNIVDIKPANMEELTEVITAAEFHPNSCNTFVYSSSKGTIRLCDMRASALCDRHSKLFEEPEDPSNRSFFSEIISSISDVKFSHSGRYMMTRDYLSVKIWDLNMENRPVETYQVHEYLRSKLCSLYENDCIFDKFECCWNGSDSIVMTGSYNNFFRMFDRNTKRDITLEASRENNKPRTVLKPRKVCASGKRKKDEISVDSLDFNKKILHTAWHPKENIIAVATTNNLYIFQDKMN